MSENTHNISPSILAYLKRIGKVPLLKPEEEKALFDELRIQKTLLGKVLSRLQNSNMLSSEQQGQLKKVFRIKQRRGKDGQMKISPESLGKLQDLIDGWRANAAIGVPNNTRGKSKPLQPEEFEEILTKLQSVAQSIQDIQKRLVEANLLLVANIAKQFTFCEFPLSFLDLMQEGSIGLMKAVHKFKLEKGHRFSTYATWWINQAIRRALDEQSQLIRVPVYIIEAQRRTAKAFINLTKCLGREPKMSELAEAVNLTQSRLHNILQAPKDLLSLDFPIEAESDDRTTVADLIKDKITLSPEDEMLSKARQEAMEKLLSTLTPKQTSVIKLRYGLFDGESHNLAQIGRKLKISRERVRQIEAEALNKLRHPNRRRYWEELLE